MNQIINRAAGSLALASLKDLKTGLQNVTSTIVSVGGDPFLRLGTDGVWVYGAENIEVQDGSRWAVNPLSLQHGWVAWTDRPGKQANEIVGEVMVPMTSPLPPYTELRDVSGPDNAKWAQQLKIQLVCLTGEDKGTQVDYKTTSVGGTNAIKSLIASIMAQLDKDADRPVPVIVLESESYMHKKWGKTYTPVFDIHEWVEMSAEAPAVEEKSPAEAEKAAAPSRTRRGAAGEDKAAPEKAAVEPTAADRKAALMAQLAELDDDGEAEGGAAPEPAPQDDAAPRRRRRA